MSIIHTFDADGEGIMDPNTVVEKIENFPETVLVFFSRKFEALLCKAFETEQIGYMVSGQALPIYRFEYSGKPLAFYPSPIGGPATVALLEEIIAMGAKNILFFGSCGALDKEIVSGNLIVPTAAYRDEGTSYHYAPASDYIEIKSADRLAEIFDEMNVAYRKTKIWTTDGVYRETQKNAELRKKDGCAAVDMECASIMACGQFRNTNVYQFVYAADCLDGGTWDSRILGKMPDDLRERILKVALETAIRL